MALPPAARVFLEAMQRRYACKLYDGSELSSELEEYILECGRLSPSSFGLEHWKFVVTKGLTPMRESLFKACFAQEAVSSAGLVITILVRAAAAYDPDSGFVVSRSERFPGGHPVFHADYVGYHGFLDRVGRIEGWARAQAYIACANMMTGAAAAGIDSCAIEGFDEEAVLAALGVDPTEWRVGLMAVFGRSAEPPREKIREPLDRVVEYRS
jgi:nitroreductase